MRKGQTIDMVERFWSKVDRRSDDECWEWGGSRGPRGYGVIAAPFKSTRLGAHRYSAMLHFGMFDRRLIVCHTCDNPPCVNPAHLYLGTNADNTADMLARGRQRKKTDTHCKRGHAFEPDNAYVNHRGQRQCKTCVIARSRQTHAARKAAQ